MKAVRRKWRRAMLHAFLVLFCYVAFVILFNRFRPIPQTLIYSTSVATKQAAKDTTRVAHAMEPDSVGQKVSFFSWNLGYAGLDHEANFVVDGGTDWLPKTRNRVEENARYIASTIAQSKCDVMFLQELAGPSFINRNVDLKSMVQDEIPEFSVVYAPDTETRWVPYPLRMNMGKATASRMRPLRTIGQILPLENGYYAGILRRHYRLLASRFKTEFPGQELVAINVHLAAFDDGATRLQQLDAVLDFAEREYSAGNFVIIGGDWNLRLVPTDFPHQTDEEFLFWLADFPVERLPSRWQIAADPTVPTVRTVHKRFEPSDNYVCVIDGFILSPNVEVLTVKNVDVRFRHTDHQPVTLQVRLLPPQASAD